MISAGNDIVALNAVDRLRTIQPRFYSKILSLSEQELYSRQRFAGLPFENFVWLLWSVKESVYKYRRRIEPGLLFSPKKIIVQELGARGARERDLEGRGGGDLGAAGQIGAGCGHYQGIVHSGSTLLYSRSTIHADHISTVVSADEQFDQVWWGVARIDRSDHAGQSAMVRSLVLDKLHSLLPSEGALSIEKSRQGCPLVCKGGKDIGVPVSLAHHDQFIAYSFRLQGTGAPLSSRDFA